MREMKQKVIRGPRKGKKPAIRQAKRFDPIPARWWRAKGSESTNRDDDRRGRDW
jgi:hypothetical protein